MQRRRFLSVAVGALAGISGCGSDPPTTTVRASTTSKPTTSTEPMTVSETDAGLKASIETDRYLIRSFAQNKDQRAIEPEDITPLNELSDPLRSALEAALEGGFETDEVGEKLLAGIDRFRHFGAGHLFEPYFSVNGIPYVFDPSVPEFVASLDRDVEDAGPDKTITGDDLEGLAEPAQDFVRTLGAYGTMVARDEYRISVVPPSVEALLDRYDYVRDPSGVGRIDTERLDPGPPYRIHTHELTLDDIWGRPVHCLGSLPPDLREFVNAVVASDRRSLVYPAFRTEHRTDDLPAGYDQHLGQDQGPGSGPYVEIDGTMYAFRLTEIRRDHVPLDVSVRAADSDTFELTVAPSDAGSKPAIDNPIEVQGTWLVPGPLWVHSEGTKHRLDRVETLLKHQEDGESRPITDTETISIPTDNELMAIYRVPTEVPPGTYRAWGLVDVSWVAAESDRPTPQLPFPFKVLLSIPES